MFESYYDAKTYYKDMISCLDGYRICIRRIIEIQKQIDDEDFIRDCLILTNSKIITPEDIIEGYRRSIRHYEKAKCRKERQFQERYGVQTSEELETKIREFEPELKRLKEALELQKTRSRNSLRKERESKSEAYEVGQDYGKCLKDNPFLRRFPCPY